VGNGHVQSVLVPMKEPGYNHIATIWGFNIYSENTTYNFMRNDECDPSYAKLGWLFQIMDKQVFNVDPKGMRISKRESHLKTYDYIIEDCYWMDYYKVYGVAYTFIGSREYCPTSGYWVDTNPNPNSGNIPHGSGGSTTPPAKPKPGTEPVPTIDVDTSITKNPKLSCLWDKIMAVGIGKRNPLVINFLANFSNTFSTNNISIIAMPGLKSETSGQECYAKTDPTDINDIKIYLNGDYVNNRSSIEVALTLAHEIVHANLFRYYTNSSGKFVDMFSKYIEQTKGKSYFDQHELMRQEYIPILANFLRQFDSLNGISDSNENYIKLAMDGLEKTNTEIKTSIDIENYFRNNRGLNCK
jgi:hypothetical protein